MDKSPDAFRTISEVSEWLDTPAHVLRFWESRFAQVKPVKRAGGRRYYRPNHMLLLGGIKKLLHDDGMTIRGVQKIIREQGVKHVSGLSQPISEGDVIDASVVPEAPMHEDAPPLEATDNVVSLAGFEAAPEPAPEPPAERTQAGFVPASDPATETTESTAPPETEAPAGAGDEAPAPPDAADTGPETAATSDGETEAADQAPEDMSDSAGAEESADDEFPLQVEMFAHERADAAEDADTSTAADSTELPAPEADAPAEDTVDEAAPEPEESVQAPAEPTPLGADLPQSDPDDDAFDAPEAGAEAARLRFLRRALSPDERMIVNSAITRLEALKDRMARGE